MKVELFPFQRRACNELRSKIADALGDYYRTHAAQVISFTAPTGSGKTIIMAALMEDIYCGTDIFPDQPEAIFVWLSDSPQLNEQSRQKIDTKADKIQLGQCVTIQEDSFDQEMLDDGHIYFLNTQKLGKNSNLTKHSDSRTYTIWETIANTAREKSNRLYFIIDEAHRGTQGRDAKTATTIMQKFLKGSVEDGIGPMPVVIGMSATMERFNTLVEGTESTIRKCTITAEEVRESGLLKDRIIITYPEENAIGKEMAVLQAAADNWKQKWDHWAQYCQEQHYANVNPVFVIQVLNGSGDKISDTNLDDCLEKVEERTGFHFEPGEVVHTFGQTSSAITMNGLEVPYEEPSQISDNRKIKVVFFKENLSTGWDCPRAETMMSFRHAVDATYIAQLLGRMVRTPTQSHIQVDDVLNDVHLYLPNFDEETVKQVVKDLQSTEGGDIPTDIRGERMDDPKLVPLTIHPKKKAHKAAEQVPGQMSLEDYMHESEQKEEANGMPFHQEKPASSVSDNKRQNVNESRNVPEKHHYEGQQVEGKSEENTDRTVGGESVLNSESTDSTTSSEKTKVEYEDVTRHVEEPGVIGEIAETGETANDLFDREAVMKFINDAGLLTYHVRNVQISNYLSSMFKMVHFLSETGLYPDAVNDVINDIVQMIREYIDSLIADDCYDVMVEKVQQFELQTQVFNIYGESVDDELVRSMFTSTDIDIDRQYRIAESKLGNDGVGNEYGRQYVDWNNPNAYKIDVILFSAEPECIAKLNDYAEKKFHELNDEYRRRVATLDSEKIHKQYDSIVSDGDIVSKHSFRLPETIMVPHDTDGKEYRDHLFVDEDTGIARIKLNSWEEGVLEEEEQREDFVCWIRNPVRGSWSLTIPYEYDTITKSAYPDLIVVRKDEPSGYIIDILEPHMPKYDDNLGKAKGFAEYARQNPGIGRIQLIREGKDAAGRKRFKRLDMSKSVVRDKVSHAITQDELNHLFDEYGVFNK